MKTEGPVRTEMRLMKSVELLDWLQQELQSDNGPQPLLVPTNNGGILIGQNGKGMEVSFAADGENTTKEILTKEKVLPFVDTLLANDGSQPWWVNPTFLTAEKVSFTLPWFQLTIDLEEGTWSLLTPEKESLGWRYLNGLIRPPFKLNLSVFSSGRLVDAWVVCTMIDGRYGANADMFVRTGREGYRVFDYRLIQCKSLLYRQPPFDMFEELLRFLWARRDEEFDPARLFVSGDVGFYFVGETANDVSNWFETKVKAKKPGRVDRHEIEGFSFTLHTLRLMKAGVTIKHPDHPPVTLPQTGFYDVRQARGLNFADTD